MTMLKVTATRYRLTFFRSAGTFDSAIEAVLFAIRCGLPCAWEAVAA